LTYRVDPARHDHGRRYQYAMVAGLKRHGIKEGEALTITWGHRYPPEGQHLVMEQGYLGNRLEWCSLGFNGLNGRATFPKAPDGERFNDLFPGVMRSWKDKPGYALVIGQCPGDAALAGTNIDNWVATITDSVPGTKYRPHPSVTAPAASLDDDLSGARCCITYNSNAGVMAVMAGVPTITMDRGAMAWNVSSHNPQFSLMTDRDEWAHDMAYSQWTLQEIEQGLAWEHLQPVWESINVSDCA